MTLGRGTPVTQLRPQCKWQGQAPHPDETGDKFVFVTTLLSCLSTGEEGTQEQEAGLVDEIILGPVPPGRAQMPPPGTEATAGAAK